MHFKVNDIVPGLRDGASLAVETGRNGSPGLGQSDHGAGIKHTEAEKVVELEADPIHCPLESAFSIKERVTFGRQYCQMLDVPPCQQRAVFFFCHAHKVKGKFIHLDLTYTGTAYLASRASAKTPAASGAAAEVPEWVLVHLP